MKQFIYVPLFIICLFLISCSNNQEKTNTVTKQTKSTEQESQINAFKEIKDLYQQQDYLSTIHTLQEKYPTLKGTKYDSDINKIYNESIKKLLENKSDAIVLGILNRKDVTMPQLSNDVQKLVDDAKSKMEKDKIDKIANEILQDIDNKRYYSKYSTYNSYEKYNNYKDDPTIKNLMTYSSLLSQYGNRKDATNPRILDEIALLNPSYNGIRADEINNFVAKYMNREQWIERYNRVKAIDDSLKAERDEYNKKPNPTIGMTTQEVLNSKWGKPINVNKTTTTYGLSEQWVYNKGYLYFENGKLTAIQE